MLARRLAILLRYATPCRDCCCLRFVDVTLFAYMLPVQPGRETHFTRHSLPPFYCLLVEFCAMALLSVYSALALRRFAFGRQRRYAPPPAMPCASRGGAIRRLMSARC